MCKKVDTGDSFELPPADVSPSFLGGVVDPRGDPYRCGIRSRFLPLMYAPYSVRGVGPEGGPYIPTPFRQGHWPDVGHSTSRGGRRILGPLLSNGILENDGQLTERVARHVVVVILAVGGIYITLKLMPFRIGCMTHNVRGSR